MVLCWLSDRVGRRRRAYALLPANTTHNAHIAVTNNTKKKFLGLALSSHANLFESLDQFSPLIVLDHVAAV